MDVAQSHHVDLAPFSFEISHLAGDEFLASGRDGDFAQQDRDVVARRKFCARNDFKRDRQQSVAGKHGDAVAENFVTSRAPATKIVVVHARKIVVHERVGVDAFERAGERQRLVDLAAACFGRGETQNRSQSFSAGEKTVAHRLVNGRRSRVLFRQIAVECAIDLFLPRLEIRLQVHSLGVWKLSLPYAIEMWVL